MSNNPVLGMLQKVMPEDINAEICVVNEKKNWTRFRKNLAKENLSTNQTHICVRVEQGGRVGTSYSNRRLTVSALRDIISQARKNALSGRPGPLILTGSTGYRSMGLFHQETAESGPQHRNELLSPVLEFADRAGLIMNGNLAVKEGEIHIANSVGLATAVGGTWSRFNVRVTSEDQGVGHGYTCSRNIDNLKVLDSALEASAKCQASSFPQPVPQGKYTVILEPAAVADLMRLMAVNIFNGRLLAEGKSHLEIGNRIFGDNINIWDDGLDPRGMQMPFDYEGTPKQRLNLVSKGVISNVATDNSTAAALDLPGSGHASLWTRDLGPFPSHIFMEAGNAMLDDMIVSTRRGILVSRLNNLNIIDPKSLTMAGETAGGTLLIEQGKLTQAVPDLHFVQDLITMLNNVEMIGDQARLYGWLWGGIHVPALRVDGFNITGYRPVVSRG